MAHICQDNIIMALVVWHTQLTIESFIDSAAEFYLCVFVLLTEEFTRVVWKIVQFIKRILFLFLLLRSRLKFLESIHRILNVASFSSGVKILSEICLNWIPLNATLSPWVLVLTSLKLALIILGRSNGPVSFRWTFILISWFFEGTIFERHLQGRAKSQKRGIGLTGWISWCYIECLLVIFIENLRDWGL